MGLLDGILSADASRAFCGAGGFAEPVTWQFYPSGAQKVFSAIVYRLLPQMETGVDRVTAPNVEIELPNDPAGMAGPASINRGADKVLVADRQGGAATWHVVESIESQDSGMWRIRLK